MVNATPYAIELWMHAGGCYARKMYSKCVAFQNNQLKKRRKAEKTRFNFHFHFSALIAYIMSLHISAR